MNYLLGVEGFDNAAFIELTHKSARHRPVKRFGKGTTSRDELDS